MVLLLVPLLLAILSSPSRAGPLTAVYSIHLVMVLGWILLYLGYDYVHRVRTAKTEKWRWELAMRDTELGGQPQIPSPALRGEGDSAGVAASGLIGTA